MEKRERKEAWDILVSIKQPRKNYIPVNHRIIYGCKQKKCKFWRSTDRGLDLFSYCICPQMIELIDPGWTNVDLDLPCSVKCRFFDIGKLKRTVWIHYKGWDSKFKSNNNHNDKIYCGKTEVPKGHQLVLVYSNNRWSLKFYVIAYLNDYPWLPYDKNIYKQLVKAI